MKEFKTCACGICENDCEYHKPQEDDIRYVFTYDYKDRPACTILDKNGLTVGYSVVVGYEEV